MRPLRTIIGPAFAVAITTVGWLRWPTPWSLGLLVFAALLLLLALFAPHAFAPIQRVFESFGRIVATGFTWGVLFVLFVAIFIPGRLLLLALRRDPLRLRPDPHRSTFWEPLPQASDPARFRRQY